MVEKEIEIKLAGGLEARPVAMLVQVASLNAGEKVVVEADGSDEEAAINHIEKYLSGDN